MQPPIERLNPTPRYADATIHNGQVFAVEVPATDGDIRVQSESMLTLLEATLIKAGSSKAHLLMATVYLVDMADYTGFNAVWETWLPAGCAPARACLQVARLASPQLRVEIAIIAAQKP
jgi:enamine deaminase RidA (YjgF/YER057c/UK114 family)